MRFDLRADTELLRVQVRTEIDYQVGCARALFVTLSRGQEAVYSIKRQEALLIAADRQQGVNVPEDETPHVTAEAADDGVSRFEKAVEILTRDRHWANGSAMIESLRRRAKAALATATTPSEIRAAAVIDWQNVEDYARTL
ncbi:hypothetical protein [Rhizobium mayense]|uniref:Uncharacterized protein n=1 Tax=Rhizobium mayense TaxID=1312184 RepID=A0ABT7JNI7_9HYPH|nr:hypothetical protein [Rhizobium mayense]MDL2397472.1 hypothetical protein [Rhizobium mayense]